MRATPLQMELAPAEALRAGRTAAARLRDLAWAWCSPQPQPVAWPAGWGLSIEAGACRRNHGLQPRRNPGVVALGPDDRRRHLDLKGPGAAGEQAQPTGCSTRGPGSSLRPGDLRNARKVLRPRSTAQPRTDALRLPATKGETLPAPGRCTAFTAGATAAGGCWKNSTHQQKAPSPAGTGRLSAASLRPVQSGGLGWLPFLHRFRTHGACLADDMGLGKTIQVLAFLQHLKSGAGTKRPVRGGPHLRGSPTGSVRPRLHTRADRFAGALTPRRPRHAAALAKRRSRRRSGAHQLRPACNATARLRASMDWQGT